MLEKNMRTLDSKLIDMLEERYGPLWWPEDLYPEECSLTPSST